MIPAIVHHTQRAVRTAWDIRLEKQHDDVENRKDTQQQDTQSSIQVDDERILQTIAMYIQKIFRSIRSITHRGSARTWRYDEEQQSRESEANEVYSL